MVGWKGGGQGGEARVGGGMGPLLLGLWGLGPDGGGGVRMRRTYEEEAQEWLGR